MGILNAECRLRFVRGAVELPQPPIALTVMVHRSCYPLQCPAFRKKGLAASYHPPCLRDKSRHIANMPVHYAPGIMAVKYASSSASASRYTLHSGLSHLSSEQT